MKRNVTLTSIATAALLTLSAVSHAAPTNPLSPSFGRDTIAIAEYVNPSATTYANAANPLDPRFARSVGGNNWIATATNAKSGYRDVTNPLHPSFKRS